MLRGEAGRVRMAARSTDPMAGHAVRGGALVVAGGAAEDVPPRLGAVEARAPGSEPASGVRIERVAGVRGEPVLLVALLAEAGRMALLASRRVGAGLDLVPGDVVAPVDEVSIHPLGEDLLDLHRHRPRRLAVGAEALLVAGGAGGRGGAGDGRVGGGEVAPVAEEGGGLQSEAGQVLVADGTLAVVELLLVDVAAQAGAHRGNGLLRLTQRRKREMAHLALVLLFQVLGVVD